MEHVGQVVSVIQSGMVQAGSFGIDDDAQAHVFRVLRDYMYKNKVRAILREYASNAWDAHVVAGKSDVLISVSLPTQLNPTLIIRDYGFGLSEEEVFRVYPKYGTSTKRDSNLALGYFGIGCKSAFAYSDTFTVISRHGGIKSTYIAVQDDAKGQFNLMHSEPCGDETGMEIHIPAHVKDLSEFQKEAEYIFQFFHPTPQINHPITPFVCDVQGNFDAYLKVRNPPSPWIAVMGVVAYPIDFTDMAAEVSAAGMSRFLQDKDGVLLFDIGEINVAASRESLAYTEKTKSAIISKLKNLFSLKIQEMEAICVDNTLSPWQKRLLLRAFPEMPVPAEVKSWLDGKVVLYSNETRDGDGNLVGGAVASKNFHLCTKQGRAFKDTNTIYVSPNVKIIIYDAPAVAYNNQDAVFLTPVKGVDMKVLLAELQVILERANVAGVPIHLMSDLKKDIRTPISSSYNQKHLERRFVFNGCSHTPLSKNWDVVDHLPGPDDVFVLLSHFEVLRAEGAKREFGRLTSQHRNLLKFLGVTDFPKIYGVKTTEKAPVKKKDVPGTEYFDWFQKTLVKALAEKPELENLVSLVPWLKTSFAPYRRNNLLDICQKWEAALGSDHPICVVMRDYISASKTLHAHPKLAAIMQLWETLNPPNLIEEQIRKTWTAYPLLADRMNLDLGYSSLFPHWVEYINLIDDRNKRT